MLISSTVIKDSGIQFGTSGARGLVEQFTANVCAAFTHSFMKCMREQPFEFKSVAIAIDNRPSSPAMAQACISAIQQSGLEAVYYGIVPTPALAYVAMQDKIPCIMITGSHIPFDCNGIKFYRPDGEISKADEQAILDANVSFTEVCELPTLETNNRAAEDYISRYTDMFDASLLSGKRIGIYEHSSAGRDLYKILFEKLGAQVVSLERTDEFVPIDTEAVAECDKQKAKVWSDQYNLDFIFSTDGDGDRPLVADESGEWLRGDILGLLCSKALQIEALAVPVSCNTIIDKNEGFKAVSKTKIGSPYVIAEFQELSQNYSRIAGFEANGGYLLGSDVTLNSKSLKALPTRDAVLPAIMLLSLAKNKSIEGLVRDLPQRFTYSDRIQNFATEQSQKIISKATGQETRLIDSLGFEYMAVDNVDTTDGLRITLETGDIVHLRPSGNAPELRCYAEAGTQEQAQQLVKKVLGSIKEVDVSSW